MEITRRPRRLRNNSAIRSLVRENTLSVDDFIYPLFVVEGENIKKEISSLKGLHHFSVDKLEAEIKEISEGKVENKTIQNIKDLLKI